MPRIQRDFFTRDVLEVAPDLLGKSIAFNKENTITQHLITEVEAYRGEEDLACHASRGRTPRTEVMYHQGGLIYVYLIYGMYWMLNFVTGKEEDPQAVLIRGISRHNGPGKLTRFLGIDKSYYAEDLTTSPRIWIEDNGLKVKFNTSSRIGVEYAGEYWCNKAWRFMLSDINNP